jgi:photosystem II stability/assembly factor-like uncharacterized protein
MKTDPRRLAAAALAGLVAGTGAAAAQTWIETSAPVMNWSCVASSADGSKLAAAASPGLIYTSSDSGATWTAASPPSNYWYSIACSADGRTLFAGGQAGLPSLYLSSDSGATWRAFSIPSVGGPYCSVVSSADGSRLGAFSPWSLGFLFSGDSGTNWAQYYFIPATASTFGCNSACSADGLSFGFLDDMLDCVLYGIFWTMGPPPLFTLNPPPWDSVPSVPGNSPWGYNWGYIACSADANRVAIAARASYGTGAIAVSTNGRATWFLTRTPVTTWSGITCSADGRQMAAVAADGTVLASADSGATWTPLAAPANNWSAVASSADGALLVATVAGGGIYTCQNTPAPQLSIAPAGANIVVSWIVPSMNFVLQQNFELASTNWVDVPAGPVLNLTNLQNQVTLPASAGGAFYRLLSR